MKLSALLQTLIGIVACVSSAQSAEAGGGRLRRLFDDGWHFQLGSPADNRGGLEKAGTAPRNMGGRSVRIPHDWAVDLPFAQSSRKFNGYKSIGPDFPKNSIGWYSKEFAVDASEAKRRFWLEFEGVFRDCQVWVNGFYLGRNESGYIGFRHDITDLIEPGEKNNVVVRVDATGNEGWWYEGAGIYRHVWLTTTDPLAIEPDGLFVYSKFETNTPQGAAAVWAEAELRNDSRTDQEAQVIVDLMDPKGQKIGSSKTVTKIKALGKALVKQSIPIQNPALWSPESPTLYAVVASVESGGKITDQVTTPMGIRTLEFNPKKGFLLNGKPYLIKGSSNHQDFAGVGVALPDALQNYKIQKMKEFGLNGYRTAHHPPAPALLDACDRLGMLVMNENRLLSSSQEQMSQFERQLRRDRNHPSVFIWSIGNEENSIQVKPVAERIARSLADLSHRIDPTRLVTHAANVRNVYAGANKAVDVRGWNYANWKDADAYQAEHPEQPQIITEFTGSGGTRGVYFGKREELQLKGYGIDNCRTDWWLALQAHPYLSGAFPWTGFDYRGEPNPRLWPQVIGNYGALDLCGFPKAGAYGYKAVWTEQPFAKILPDWSLPGKEGSEVVIGVYTNGDQIELLLDNQSLGRQKPVHGRADFKVTYRPGGLLARVYRQGALIAEARSDTAGAPANIQLEPDRTNLKADDSDVAVVNVRIVDEKGHFVPDADNLVEFSLEGSGSIIGVGNGDPLSHESEKEPRRKAFNGLCQVLIQTTRRAGEIRLNAKSNGLKAVALALKANESPLDAPAN